MIAETPTQTECTALRPGRLWSLWDMLKFKADDFYDVTKLMQHTLTSLEVNKRQSLREEPGGGVSVLPIDKTFAKIMIERCDELDAHLDVLGAPITKMAVAELRNSLRGKYPTYEGLADGYRDIGTTLRRELSQATLLSLTPSERQLFEPDEPPFGLAFDVRFGDRGVFELDEAAKCMALGRPTAAAFHLMRVMEVAIQAVAKCLQIPDPTKPAERNWGNILRTIKEGMDSKWPTTASRMSGDGQLFEELHASLDAAKNPWRNTTMHVDKKYTDTEVQDIFAAVRGFMRKLADRMDEDGKPLA